MVTENFAPFVLVTLFFKSVAVSMLVLDTLPGIRNERLKEDIHFMALIKRPGFIFIII